MIGVDTEIFWRNILTTNKMVLGKNVYVISKGMNHIYSFMSWELPDVCQMLENEH